MANDDLRLVPVDRRTWRDAYALRPHPEQEHFVAPNAFSLLEALYAAPGSGYAPFVAYVGPLAVGFTMHATSVGDGHPWILRFMVGRCHQGRGYGTRMLRAHLALLDAAFPGRAVRLSVVPGNDAAARLYRRFGFVDTGRVQAGELVFERPAGATVNGAADGTADDAVDGAGNGE